MLLHAADRSDTFHSINFTSVALSCSYSRTPYNCPIREASQIIMIKLTGIYFVYCFNLNISIQDWFSQLDDFRNCLGLSHDLFTVSHRFLDRYHDVLKSSYLDVKTIHRKKLWEWSENLWESSIQFWRTAKNPMCILKTFTWNVEFKIEETT